MKLLTHSLVRSRFQTHTDIKSSSSGIAPPGRDQMLHHLCRQANAACRAGSPHCHPPCTGQCQPQTLHHLFLLCLFIFASLSPPELSATQAKYRCSSVWLSCYCYTHVSPHTETEKKSVHSSPPGRWCCCQNHVAKSQPKRAVEINITPGKDVPAPACAHTPLTTC